MEKSTVAKTNLLYMGLAFVVALLIMYVPLGDGIRNIPGAQLTNEGQTALAVLAFALILWMTEAIPFHITGLLSLIILAVSKIDTFKNIVLLGFGNDIIVFFIGVLILSAFITKSGLGKRISLLILSITGNKTSHIILGFLITGAILAMWITEMAAAAMLMPLARSILQEEDVEPLKSNFGKALMIATAWGPVVGGVGTPAGSGSNTLAVSFLKEMAGIDLTFVHWMIFGVPCVILLIYPTWIIILKFFKPEMEFLKKSKEDMMAEFKDQPRMNHEQRVTISLFVLTIFLWITSSFFETLLGINIPISLPVILTACLFFFPGMSGIKWKEIEKDVSWSGIILVVTGISLGLMLYNTGAAMWVSSALLGGIGNVPIVVQIFAIIIIVSLLKIVFSSNTVTGTIIIPIIIAMAETLGLSPLAITMPAAITSSLAFILVTSSPTNVIPYSAGYFSIKDMAKAGVVLTIVASIILTVSLYITGKITGIY